MDKPIHSLRQPQNHTDAEIGGTHKAEGPPPVSGSPPAPEPAPEPESVTLRLVRGALTWLRETTSCPRCGLPLRISLSLAQREACGPPAEAGGMVLADGRPVPAVGGAAPGAVSVGHVGRPEYGAISSLRLYRKCQCPSCGSRRERTARWRRGRVGGRTRSRQAA